MRKNTTSLMLAGLLLVLASGLAKSEPAAPAGCANGRSSDTCNVSGPAAPFTRDLAAQTKRPRITIYRRYVPGPNAVRQCRSWLATEYRISGTVIVPQMRCWWEE